MKIIEAGDFHYLVFERLARERGLLARDFNWYDRNYNCEIDGFRNSNVPLWIEHLSPEFIRSYMEAWETIALSSLSFHELALPKLKSFFFEWSVNGLKKKRQWSSTAGRVILSKLRTRFSKSSGFSNKSKGKKNDPREEAIQ